MKWKLDDLIINTINKSKEYLYSNLVLQTLFTISQKQKMSSLADLIVNILQYVKLFTY